MAAALLSGCALGIQPDGSSPSESFQVARSYQTVFLRAENQAQECLRGASDFKVIAKVDPATQTGLVSVADPLTGVEVARTELKALDARNTQVTQTVWGRAPWDLGALHAMGESVRADVSMCIVYQVK